MTRRSVVVLDYGSGNLRSAQRALERVGADVEVTSDRTSALAATLEEKLACQKRIKELESQRNSKRKSLFDAQDEIDERKSSLIGDVEERLQQSIEMTEMFAIRWSLV